MSVSVHVNLLPFRPSHNTILTGRFAIYPSKSGVCAVTQKLGGLLIDWTQLLAEATPVRIEVHHHEIKFLDDVVEIGLIQLNGLSSISSHQCAAGKALGRSN